jgi:hypothetical protein
MFLASGKRSNGFQHPRKVVNAALNASPPTPVKAWPFKQNRGREGKWVATTREPSSRLCPIPFDAPTRLGLFSSAPAGPDRGPSSRTLDLFPSGWRIVGSKRIAIPRLT